MDYTLLGEPGLPRGENHPGAKLTEPLVREIRDLHSKGYGYTKIAKAVGVSVACIARVVRRETWAHVE